MDQEDQLCVLESSLFKAAMEIADNNASSEDLQAKINQLFLEVENECKASFLSDIEDRFPKILSDNRRDCAAFEARNFQRWKPSFNHLETMCLLAREFGEMHGKSFKKNNPEASDNVMAALAQIFPRALLVSEEIICLLKGGFPDGALARWRSLHELAITAKYISKHGEEIATLYLLSFHFLARNSARQMNEHSERANIDPISDEELKFLDERCEQAEAIIGRNIGTGPNSEWPAINKKHSTFKKIEENVEMDHWRPRYKWATTYTHANYRPMEGLLGSTGRTEDGYLVGQSSLGYTDPFQMTAITLMQITATYLMHGVNVDRLVMIRVMKDLSDQMSIISIQNEQSIVSSVSDPLK
ncbi:DUF5677 domain-containing protein [Pseudochrobactrum saccharolyticum]|uniref:DUF5677 domain-containing protein n=1 Tax=Pseudochrobactrum saccharolyticum TaxID=354352 RepID=UPI0027484CBE|nr:DUF5677 domain-containing protein [Pseudochrobactrum saccharolyticum]MDP8250855.1 hypothetical protein [Pseudochrobactrum saccharolyticum]